MPRPDFDSSKEVKPQSIKFGKIDDWCKGTYLSKRETRSSFPGKEGQKQMAYEFRMAGGEFHRLNETKEPIEPAVEVAPGSIWTVWGNEKMDNQLRNIPFGHVVAFHFAGKVPSKTQGFAPANIIKVYDEGVDPEYMGEEAEDIETVPFN